MKQHTSRNSHRDEKLQPSRNADSDAILRANTQEERRRRRREWMIEQEKMDRHKRLKRKMIMEYEIQRARNMSLAFPEGRCNRPRRSRSESPPSRHRRISKHYTPKVIMLSKKFETLSGTTSLFKELEGTKISSTELRKIKVDIHRNIPGRAATDELKRDVPNKEDVVLKRRAGEGSKPIFDREEIRRARTETETVEEHRTVVTVNLENSENNSKTLKRRSASLSPTRTRNHSPRRTSSPHRREKDYSKERKDGDKSCRDHRERPCDHSRDRRKTDRYRESMREKRQRDRLFSMPGDIVNERRTSLVTGKVEQIRFLSVNLREKGERKTPPQYYIQQIPVSIYHGNFQPKPLVVGPWVPIRGPLGGNIHPPMMRPFRTWPPRSIRIAPDMYGFRPPLNPRFPQIF
ncbi:uncharacterized protein LOC143366929 isoform X2 [Andrena cerasifolii]|uniref:uncharacterized protein LOC143366929 isoform X2 n=1 Tax=Andrena cerasifolii TaxID=2819439 RepID=UPI0040380BEF